MSRSERAARASQQASTSSNSEVIDKWKRVGAVARRAEADDSTSSHSMDIENAEERERYLEKKRQDKAEREKIAKTMGLEYFLEMVSRILTCSLTSSHHKC